jgi:hypothetical protein
VVASDQLNPVGGVHVAGPLIILALWAVLGALLVGLLARQVATRARQVATRG